MKNILLSFLICCCQYAGAQNLEIVIDRGIENTLPIAIIPFGWESSELAPVNFALTVSNDLARSGRFASIQAQDLPQRPNQFKDINFSDWRLLGMENLVIGNLNRLADGSFEVEFRLVDVYKEEQIAGYRIPASSQQLRRTAHRISDIVFEALTGIRGAFDTRIAYVTVTQRQDKKIYNLQIADADGFNPKVLLESEEPLLSPAWSPDGRQLAYVSFESRNSSIYIQDIITGQRQLVAANPGINSAPAWSPDGSRLALTLSMDGDPEIYIIHVASQTLQRITRHKAIDTEPNWSPAGDKIAFTSDRGGTPQIYEISVMGGNPKRLTFSGAYNARPRYSPDGSNMTMVHVPGGGEYKIAVLDLNTSYLTVLTDSRLDESPSFAPNGSMIIYATTGRRGSELAAVSVDGRVHQRLAMQVGEVREPSWGPFPK